MLPRFVIPPSTALTALVAIAGCATSPLPEPVTPGIRAVISTNPPCVADVDSALAVLSRDYAAYRDNAAARPAALAAVVDSARQDARTAADGGACLAAIRR